MAIGQYIASLNKNSNGNIQREIEVETGKHEITRSVNRNFELKTIDGAIVPETGSLIENNVYALEMDYEYFGKHDSGAVLILSDDNETVQMVISTVEQMTPGQIYNLKIIFSPNRNVYTRIVLKSLNRDSAEDYGEDIGTNIINAKLHELKNIIPVTSPLKRVGIQGYEGLSFSINKEDFQIGRSGYYTAEDLDINFISFFIAENEPPFDNTNRKFFIMDYEY